MATRKRTTKKTANKKATPKKKEMQYADGRDERRDVAKTVEDLMAVKTRDPFAVASGEAFEEAVTSMSLSQMQEIAVKSGVFPSGTKATLRNKLLKEYENRNAGRYGGASKTQPIVDPKSERAKKIIKILNE